MKTADGYVRVSSTAGRSGESFISPKEQRAAIEAWAKATKTKIVAWHEDLDQSGGTLDRPGFKAAMERCRSGVTGGVVAAKLDRLTRSVVGLASLLDDAKTGGFNVVALDLGLDMHTANGKLVANVLGSVAEWERDRRRDDWAAAQRNAVERGIPNGRAPFGYRKRDDGRLEIVKRDAEIVRKAFRLRADGVAFSEIGRRFGWGHSTTRQILGNDAYLGVARSGRNVNESAHPPIVERDLFAAANKARTKRPVPPGVTTVGLLLQGLARCGGCGKTLKVVRASRGDGHIRSYYCKDAATKPCRDRAFVHVDALDGFVAAWFTEALKGVPRLIDVVAAARDLEDAQAEQATAESELYAFVEQASALDPGLFQRGVDARQARVDETRTRVEELSAQVTSTPAKARLIQLWQDFDAAERRDVLGGFLESVTVYRGASSDLRGNVEIVWADGTFASVADDEGGVRVAAA